MRWLTNLALTATLLVAAIGCDKPVNPKVDSFIYALALGNQWGYDYQVITDFAGPKPDDTLSYTITATVVRVDTVLPGIYSYTIRETSDAVGWPEPPPEIKYANLPDGMYRLRPDGQSSLALPKHSPKSSLVTFRGHEFGSVQALIASLVDPVGMNPEALPTIYDPLPLVLPYPQQFGQRWTYRQAGTGQELGIDKVITGGSTIKTAAGSFECHVIHWIYDPLLEGVEVVEFISGDGLILRRVEALGMVIPDVEHPDDGDTADVVATYELSSLILY